MRNPILAALMVLVAVNTAAAQDYVTFRKEYSIEVSTGIPPLTLTCLQAGVMRRHWPNRARP
jgi:hypothetical protein